MVSKTQIKLIKSLHQKKHRWQHGLFFVEGVKGITEFLNSSFNLYRVFTTKTIFNVPESKVQLITNQDLKKISALKNPNTALALFEIKPQKSQHLKGLTVALDSIRDPGNLGTIIRLCDWFNVSQIICSPTTVDAYNPKVVQASMGSLSRIPLYYDDLSVLLKQCTIPIYGTFMNGNSIYNLNIPNEGVVVFGNEANGISETLNHLINKRITIPQFGIQQSTESLNVASACGIILSAFKSKATEK